jgi:hypothetical protein
VSELQVTAEAISVFLSYSRKDKDMLDKLITHLAGLRRTGKITTWHDRDIEAGSEWEPEIRQQLDTADIIVLLISADFINSDYCYGQELRRAIKRHDQKEARVIPVILHPCDWNMPEIPFSKLNVLPRDAEPIVSSQWPYPNEAFAIVAKGIREASDQLKNIKLSAKEQMIVIPSPEQPAEVTKPNQQELLQQYNPDELASDRGINYVKLRELLVAKQWKEADLETTKRMCEAMNRQEEGWLRIEDIKDFPCIDLRTIDALWVNHSNGKFGFSVQKRIWEECNSPMEYNEDLLVFHRRVGWYDEDNKWAGYGELQFSSESSPVGEIPVWWVVFVGFGWVGLSSLLSRNDL